MISSSSEVLNIRNLQVSYGKNSDWVLNGFNLEINKGERIALIGSSGCGKSTVARAVMQLFPEGSICDGEIFLSGQNLHSAV